MSAASRWEQLLNKIMERDTFVKSGDKLRNLTLSVGIALYVSDARTYTELYKKPILHSIRQNKMVRTDTYSLKI